VLITKMEDTQPFESRKGISFNAARQDVHRVQGQILQPPRSWHGCKGSEPAQ